MPAFKDLSGKDINGINVLRLQSRGGGRVMWVFLCRCGKEFISKASNVLSGNTRSCGCLSDASRRSTENKFTIHGHSRKGKKNISAEYNSWHSMKSRCLNKNAPNFVLYGGRGITVCDRWKVFKNFLEDMGERPKGKTLDRINVNGNYEPSNCRWATLSEQQKNKRCHVGT